jgi:hypothetical protein
VSRYRKKPVIIDAWHWQFAPEQEPAPGWMNDAIGQAPGTLGSAAFKPDHPDGPRIEIVTLEDGSGEVHVARPGDWIIRGVKGELYPCKDDIFRATYELVEDPYLSSVPSGNG